MKQFFEILLLAFVVTASMDAQDTAAKKVNVTAGIDFNSAYVFHGMTYNDGPVLQPYLCVAGGRFIYNMWSNYNLVSDDNGLGHFDASEFTEIDHFFTYLVAFEPVVVDVTFGIYNYPMLGWPSDKELQIGAEKTIGGLLTPFARAGYMVDGAMEKNLYIEFGSKGEKALNDDWSLNYLVKASWENQDFIPGSPSGFRHLLATVGITYMTTATSGITAIANYVGQLDDEILVDALYDVDFHASIGAFINF